MSLETALRDMGTGDDASLEVNITRRDTWSKPLVTLTLDATLHAHPQFGYTCVAMASPISS